MIRSKKQAKSESSRTMIWKMSYLAFWITLSSFAKSTIEKEIKEMENAFLRRKNQFQSSSRSVGADFCYSSVVEGKCFRIFFIYILPYDLLRCHVFASCSAMRKIVNKVVRRIREIAHLKRSTENDSPDNQSSFQLNVLYFNCLYSHVLEIKKASKRQGEEEITGWRDLHAEHCLERLASYKFLARG